MERSSNKTYVIGHAGLLNDCRHVHLCNSLEDSKAFENIPGSLSLYNIEAVYKNLENERLGTRLDVDSEGVFVFPGTSESGFDLIIYLSESDEVLGYTKFDSPQGSRNRRATVRINITERLKAAEENSLDISYLVKDLVKVSEEKSKYESTLISVKDAKGLADNFSRRIPFSIHATSSDNLFLGSYSVINSETVVELGILSGEVINPYPETTFSNYGVSYYGGSDICFTSWGKDSTASRWYFNIVSLINKDHFGNPKSYIDTKEGRAWCPVWIDNITNPEIKYIAGRYLVCNVPSVGLKVYDTFRNIWETKGETIIANPEAPRNTIYSLPSKLLLLRDLKKLVPELNHVFIPKRDEEFVRLYSVRGRWVVYTEELNSRIVYVVCGPRIRAYFSESEIDNLMYLNDEVLILKTSDNYSIYYVTDSSNVFISPGLSNMSIREEDTDKISTSPCKIATKSDYKDTLGLYRRRDRFPKNLDIVGVFSGLIFYKESNILYYL